MNHKAELALQELEKMLHDVNPRTQNGRKLIQSILCVMEIVEWLGEEYVDMESDLSFIRQQYAGYPPFPLDDDVWDGDIDEDDE